MASKHPTPLFIHLRNKHWLSTYNGPDFLLSVEAIDTKVPVY